MGFLGVYKAIYDYVPQSEGELAITEGDILYVLEKSGEDDWWRAKRKASGEDEDEPVGLIPNNYIEEAQPISQARALYDYTRQTDEELSFTEDSQLEVFDTSDPDWILVGLEGEYGFVPANYIEWKILEGALTEPPAPSLPRRPGDQSEETGSLPMTPRSPASIPAAEMAGISSQRAVSAPAPKPQYTPEASDDDAIPTPMLPVRPSSQTAAPRLAVNYSPRSPSPPGGPRISPPYNRASQNRAADDDVAAHVPGGYHMYNINEMVSVMGKRKKMPTTLGINIAAGIVMIAPEKTRDGPEMKWTAEKMTHYSIEGKHVFLELVKPFKSVDFHAGAKDTAQEIVAALGELAGAVKAEGLREVIMAGSGQSQKKGQVLYDFMAQGDDEVTVVVGDEVIIIDDTKSDEWWQVRRLGNGKEGVVPSSYVEVTGITQNPSTDMNTGRSRVEQNRLEEERLTKDSLGASKSGDPRGSEVGPGMRLPERGSSLSAQESSNTRGQQRSKHERSDGQSRDHKSKPDRSKVRTWTDRSKSFSVEAQFLALKDGKINLHKMNGVKIAVPVAKMSVEDLEYVERQTGLSLDDEKPLSGLRRTVAQEVTIPRDAKLPGSNTPEKPDYDWFQFFLGCEVSVQLCERYSQAFQRDSMDESVLPDIDATVLRTLGLREGDIIKVMRFLDKKFSRSPAKRGVSFGREETTIPDGESQGSLFSGPGGTLKNNTRKGRPAPVIQTNNIIDPDVFSQDAKDKSAIEGIPTPTNSTPAPIHKDPVKGGFDDDAWDVKPSKQTGAGSTAPLTKPESAPAAPQLTGAMGDLSLLSAPLEPTKLQPTSPHTARTPPQQAQAPQAVTPSFFAGIGAQQTGLSQQQIGLSPLQTIAPNLQNSSNNNNQLSSGLNIARQRPAPPHQHQTQSQGSLLVPTPPNRPLSAPNANQQSPFSLPPLQPQATGMQTSAGYQQQIAPPGQSLNDLRMHQNYSGFNGSGQSVSMINQQPTNFSQFNNGLQNGFQQYQIQAGPPQQNFMNSTRPSSFSQPQVTGFQSSFPPQFPQQAGINSFLQPALQPSSTGMQQQNGFSSNFSLSPVPTVPQLGTAMPLAPQKTGPPPPIRFGMSGGTKKLMPQATGRRANLSQATPDNPFGF